MVNKDEIKKLAVLSRIHMDDKELVSMTSDMEQILEFVSQLKNLNYKNGSTEPYNDNLNVVREDSNPHEGGIYTKDILTLAPNSDGKYIKVDKIIKE